MAPILSELSSKISQNIKLFEKIKIAYKNSLKNPLEANQQIVFQFIFEGFAMNGAELDDLKK